MNFRDQWAKNEAGEEFLFTVEMQRRLSEHGLPVEPASLGQLPAAVPAPQRPSAPRPERTERAEYVSAPPPPPAPAFEEPDSIQIDPHSGKYIGRVKWFNATKGFGFIARGAGEELFFHKSNALCSADELTEGAWILYDVEQGQKGLEASEIEVYEEE